MWTFYEIDSEVFAQTGQGVSVLPYVTRLRLVLFMTANHSRRGQMTVEHLRVLRLTDQLLCTTSSHMSSMIYQQTS